MWLLKYACFQSLALISYNLITASVCFRQYLVNLSVKKKSLLLLYNNKSAFIVYHIIF